MPGGYGGFAVVEDRQRAVEITVVLTIVAVLGVLVVVPFLSAQRQHAHELTVRSDLRQAAMVLVSSGSGDAAPDSMTALIAAGYEPSPGIDVASAQVVPDAHCISLRHEGSGGFWRSSGRDAGIVPGQCSDLSADVTG